MTKVRRDDITISVGEYDYLKACEQIAARIVSHTSEILDEHWDIITNYMNIETKEENNG